MASGPDPEPDATTPAITCGTGDRRLLEATAALLARPPSTPRRIWSEREIPPDLPSLADGHEVVVDRSAGRSAMPESMRGCDAVITSNRILFGEALFSEFPSLLVVDRTGVGYDNIDLAAASRHAVAVCTVLDGPTASTAEHTVALMLAVGQAPARGRRVASGSRA